MIRSDNGRVSVDHRFVYKSLIGNHLKKHMKVFFITLTDQDRHYVLPNNGKEKFLFLSDGAVMVEIDQKPVELHCGDALHIDGSAECRVCTSRKSAQFIRNLGSIPCSSLRD